jgi:hypothetical protein
LKLHSEKEWRTPVFPLLNIHQEGSVRKHLADFRRYTLLKLDPERASSLSRALPRLQKVCKKVYDSAMFLRVHTLKIGVCDTGKPRENPRFAADVDLAALCSTVSPRHLNLSLVDDSKMPGEGTAVDVDRLAKLVRAAIAPWRKVWNDLGSVTLYNLPLSRLIKLAAPGVKNNLGVALLFGREAGVTIRTHGRDVQRARRLVKWHTSVARLADALEDLRRYRTG